MAKKTAAERVMHCISRHPEWDVPRICNSLALPADFIRAILTGNLVPEPINAEVRPSGMVYLSSVREKLDTRAAILKEIATLSPDVLVDEREIRQRVSGSDANRFRRAVENNGEIFKTHRIKLRLDEGEPRWWWGRAEAVSEALRLRDL